MFELGHRAWKLADRVGWLIALVFVLVGFMVLHNQSLTLHRQGQELKASSRNQVLNRAANVESWCEGIDGSRDYARRSANLTLRQTEAQAAEIARALEGRSSLTPEQVAFVRLYLDSVIALTRSAPQVLQRPFTLQDLPCETLIRQTLESPKRKMSVTPRENPITFRIARELDVGP